MNADNSEANQSTCVSSSSWSTSSRPPLIRYAAWSPDFSPGPPAVTHPSPVSSFPTRSPSIIQFNNDHESNQISASSKQTELESDPKKLKKLKANRESAARSKKRKEKYIADLVKRVEILEKENVSLLTKITISEEEKKVLMNAYTQLMNQNQTNEQVEMQNPYAFDISNMSMNSNYEPNINDQPNHVEQSSINDEQVNEMQNLYLQLKYMNVNNDQLNPDDLEYPNAWF